MLTYLACSKHDHFDCNSGLVSKRRCEVRPCKECIRKRKVQLLFISDRANFNYNWHLCRSVPDLVTLLVHKTIANAQRRENSSLSHSFCSWSPTSRWRAARVFEVETWWYVSIDVKDINRWIPGIRHSGVRRWDENWTIHWIWISRLECEKTKTQHTISTHLSIWCSVAVELLSILRLIRKWLCLRHENTGTGS